MQRVVQRSDARTVLPFEDESNDVFRFIVGGSDDESEDDLYDTLISKGRLKNYCDGGAPDVINQHIKQKGGEDDVTASCTESYSMNGSGSFSDSFSSFADSFSEQQQPQAYTFASPLPSTPRRRRRRGSFTGIVSGNATAPAVSQPCLSPAPLSNLAEQQHGAGVATSVFNGRLSRRKHGSFIVDACSASSSCCVLEDIVEEPTEVTMSTATEAEEDDIAAVVGRTNQQVEQDVERVTKVKFGQVEIRCYNLTLDQVGGYGRDGSPVLCPLTLDWSYCAGATIRKPAILYGFSSYFRQSKLKPLTVEERRTRLGVLNRMRRPQLLKWEYQSLLYQIAALNSNGASTDRWKVDSKGVFDRPPRVRVSLRDAALDWGLHSRRDSSVITWRRNKTSAPVPTPVPGEETSSLCLSQLDRTSRHECEKPWQPLPTVWLDRNPKRKEVKPDSPEKEAIEARPTFFRMPSIPVLWLNDSKISCSSHHCKESEKGEVIEWTRHAPSRTDFCIVPFDDLVSSSCRTKLKEKVAAAVSKLPRVPVQWLTVATPAACSESSDLLSGSSKDRTRAPPCRSKNFCIVPFDDIIAASCLERVDRDYEASECETPQDSFSHLQESFALDLALDEPIMTSEAAAGGLSYRNESSVSTDAPRLTPSRSIEEIEWKRVLRSPTTMWWRRNPPKATAVATDKKRGTTSSNWTPQAMVWLNNTPSKLQQNNKLEAADLGSRAFCLQDAIAAKLTWLPLMNNEQGADGTHDESSEPRDDASINTSEKVVEKEGSQSSDTELSSIKSLLLNRPMMWLNSKH